MTLEKMFLKRYDMRNEKISQFIEDLLYGLDKTKHLPSLDLVDQYF